MHSPGAMLFYWMTHLGVGTGRRLSREADSFLEDWPADDRIRFVRTVRDRACRLGHMTLTTSGGWRMRSPSLVLLGGGGGGFWRGGLTPELAKQAELAAAGYPVVSTQPPWSPPQFLICAERGALEKICTEIGVRFEAHAALGAAADLPDLQNPTALWKEEALPTGMMLEEFDFDALAWISYVPSVSRLSKRALRYEGRFGSTSFFVVAGTQVLAAPNESQAVYAASDGRVLCNYDGCAARFQTRQRLSPRFAVPLCLCTGRMPQRLADGSEIYEAVPPQIGRLVLQRLNQDRFVPHVYWL